MHWYIDLLERHFVGRISLGMVYVRAMPALEAPMRHCAAMRRPTEWEPGATAAPTKDSAVQATSKLFRAWNRSDAEDKILEKTACISTGALGIHGVATPALTSAAMMSSYTSASVSFVESPRLQDDVVDSHNGRGTQDRIRLNELLGAQGDQSDPSSCVEFRFMLVVGIHQILHFNGLRLLVL